MTIEELKALEAAATKGPWIWTQTATTTHEQAAEWFSAMLKFSPGTVLNGCGCPTHKDTMLGDDPMNPVHMVTAATTGNGPNSENNAVFIAAARNALPALLAVAEAAKELANITQQNCDEGELAWRDMKVALAALETKEPQ